MYTFANMWEIINILIPKSLCGPYANVSDRVYDTLAETKA